MDKEKQNIINDSKMFSNLRYDNKKNLKSTISQFCHTGFCNYYKNIKNYMKYPEFPNQLNTILEKINFKPYIEPGYESNVKNYCYQSCGYTYLDSIMDALIWTPISYLIPNNIHPNMLTLVGAVFSIILAYFPHSLFDTSSNQTLYRVFSGLTCISFFIYQLLDALDGKQARRLKLSSIIGELFDHGCDAVTTYFSVFLLLSLIQYGYGSACNWALQAVTFQLYCYVWYRYKFGYYRTATNSYFGVTEAQLFVILIAFISSSYPTLWLLHLYDMFPKIISNWLNFWPLNLKITTVLFYPCCSIMSILNIVEMYEIIKAKTEINNKDNKNVLMILICHFISQSFYCTSGALAQSPFCISIIIAFSGASIVWRFMISALTNTPLKLITIGTLPFYFSSYIFYILRDRSLFKSLLVCTLTIYTLVYHMLFAMQNLTIIKNELNVNLFVVNNPLERLEKEIGSKRQEKANNKNVINSITKDSRVKNIMKVLETINDNDTTNSIETKNATLTSTLNESITDNQKTSDITITKSLTITKDQKSNDSIISNIDSDAKQSSTEKFQEIAGSCSPESNSVQYITGTCANNKLDGIEGNIIDHIKTLITDKKKDEAYDEEHAQVNSELNLTDDLKKGIADNKFQNSL